MTTRRSVVVFFHTNLFLFLRLSDECALRARDAICGDEGQIVYAVQFVAQDGVGI